VGVGDVCDLLTASQVGEQVGEIVPQWWMVKNV